MLLLALDAAISNEIASGAILQFDAVNFSDAAGSATQHAVVIIVLFAHNFRQKKTKRKIIPRDVVSAGFYQSRSRTKRRPAAMDKLISSE